MIKRPTGILRGDEIRENSFKECFQEILLLTMQRGSLPSHEQISFLLGLFLDVESECCAHDHAEGHFLGEAGHIKDVRGARSSFGKVFSDLVSYAKSFRPKVRNHSANVAKDWIEQLPLILE